MHGKASNWPSPESVLEERDVTNYVQGSQFCGRCIFIFFIILFHFSHFRTKFKFCLLLRCCQRCEMSKMQIHQLASFRKQNTGKTQSYQKFSKNTFEKKTKFFSTFEVQSKLPAQMITNKTSWELKRFKTTKKLFKSKVSSHKFSWRKKNLQSFDYLVYLLHTMRNWIVIEN